jgi:DNA-binding CsgD family transcriptional regulator
LIFRHVLPAGTQGDSLLKVEFEADLIASIYEAGAFPDRWPDALHKLGKALGARGGNLIRSTASHLEMQSSPDIAEVTAEFAREGWNERNTRVSRLLERSEHAGFLTDSHLHSDDELATLPMYAEFLNPHGVAAGAATIVQGARNDALIVALEAFADHPASRLAVQTLDRLRPHLARACILSSEIQAAKVSGLVQAFNSVGSAIGLLDHGGRLVAGSNQFMRYFAELMTEGTSRLRMLDDQSDQRFGLALAHLDRHKAGLSLAVRDKARVGAAVMHLIPARNDARELFSKVATFAVIARPGNDLLPGADIIAALFDLTPAEARVARGIAQGLSPAEIAKDLNQSYETVRSHLKRVFGKTSTKRQNELTLLISKLA